MARMLGALSVTVALLTSGTALAQTGPSDASWLYAVLTDRATATATDVSVSDRGSTVVAFADAPQRSVDTEDVLDLASSWTERFGDLEPNAVLSWDKGRDERVVIVALGAPQVRAGSVTFPYRLISGRVPDTPAAGDELELRLDRRMHDLRMFIDDATANQCQDTNFDNATIEVTVVDDGSGDPIEGAEVQLFGTSSTTTPSVTGTTDATGSVTFEQASTEILTQGYYRLVVSDPAYSTTYVDQITACADQTVDILARL